jgi:hypothetical protein
VASYTRKSTRARGYLVVGLDAKSAGEIDGVIADFKSASPDTLKKVYAMTHE